MMKRKDFEIMAPVGSRESFAAALRAGADSIYFGIENLNMRSHSASAFTINDLKEIAHQCRICGVKSYLTVNTIIYGEDLPLMRKILDAAREANISAVIASDVAVMSYCNKIGQEVHLSTQLNISNIQGVFSFLLLKINIRNSAAAVFNSQEYLFNGFYRTDAFLLYLS